MKYTLLEMTQEILSSMDSEEVNRIEDTTEAMQVARAIRQCYYDIIKDVNPPEHYSLFELEPSLDNTKPTLMYPPADVTSVLWIKYNKQETGETDTRFEDLKFLPLSEFLNRMYDLDTTEDYIGSYNVVYGTDNIQVKYTDDHGPTYYTVFGDDNTIIFDTYDKTVDTTLQKSKTIAYGKKSIPFTMANSFTPDLDDELFSRLLNEAKVLCFAELKSIEHPVADRNAKRARVRSAKNKDRIRGLSDFEQLNNFARRV